jgi:aminomuconate-semialdehyde/2-hydroxymuconate-6-semialdehyde dehydrogenase
MQTPHLPLFVNGTFTIASHVFEKRSPVNNALIAKVSIATAEHVDAAVRAARAALAGPWSHLSVAARGAVLHRIADGIEARFNDFVRAEVADTGRPEAQARTLDVPRGIANFRFFADLIQTTQGESFVTPTPDGAGATNVVHRKPVGVVAVISPWNLPLLLLTWKVAPALACGNTVVAKPSEETPSSASLLAEVMRDAGLPPGVFNLVHGFGPNAAGEFLSRHPGIDALTFTGESRTGATIMKAVADGVKPVSFELGGKNAAVVFADADRDAAVAGVARSTFFNAGQVCLCTERVYVQRPLFDQFVRAMKAEAERWEIGPMISHAHRDKVLAYFKLAVAEGATVVTGGGVPEFADERQRGAFAQPTIWTGLPDRARCNREEVFGPVCHIAPFDSEDEVLARVNDSEYGLACAIWSRDLAKVNRMAPKVQAGIVWVNTWFLRDLRTPFGGVKASGIGREGGRWSLDFYSETTNVCIKL